MGKWTDELANDERKRNDRKTRLIAAQERFLRELLAVMQKDIRELREQLPYLPAANSPRIGEFGNSIKIDGGPLDMFEPSMTVFYDALESSIKVSYRHCSEGSEIHFSADAMGGVVSLDGHSVDFNRLSEQLLRPLLKSMARHYGYLKPR